ncbi:MAG: metal-dependent transcriptional regulator [Actinomycetia bacterium]|nr:metal-dependent transcriptional regulator [Actinomycetes bacterium]
MSETEKEGSKRRAGASRLSNSGEWRDMLGIPRLSATNEDYLEAVFCLGGEGGSVRSVDLANHLSVSKASVNTAIKALKQAALVEQAPYGDIQLTATGALYAAQVLERHQVLHHFLKDILGVDDQVAEAEACLMEHAVSSETLQRLIEHIGWCQAQRGRCDVDG